MEIAFSGQALFAGTKSPLARRKPRISKEFKLARPLLVTIGKPSAWSTKRG